VAKTAVWAAAGVLGLAILAGTVLLLPFAVGKGMATGVQGAADAVRNLVSQVTNGFATLTQAKITESFEVYVLGTFKEQRLNVATWKGLVSLTKKEEYWPAARAEVEVSVPVEAPLYVSLERGKWDFVPKGNTLYVLCPEITCGKAAPETLQLKKSVLTTSWRVSETRMLKEAETELWQTMQRQVILEAKKSRETARQGVLEFVRNWFVKAHPEGKGMEIQVLFPDEKKD
jgi:hypothetical protein